MVCILAVGFTNGAVKILDALNLQDEDTESFRYARDAVTHIKFSHDSEYLATAVSAIRVFSLIGFKSIQRVGSCVSFICSSSDRHLFSLQLLRQGR